MNAQWLTADILRMLLLYDPATGAFYWRKTSRRGWAGKPAGNDNGRYVYVRIKLGDNEQLFLAHRLAWLWMTGEWPSKEIDHKNEVKTDNRWENLRLATHSQNSFVRTKLRSHNTTGVTGVYRYRNSWKAEFTGNGVKLLDKRFDTKEDAIAARKAVADKYHSEFGGLQ